MKRLIAAALSLSLCVPAALAAESPAFSDVPADAWYAPCVALCAEQGLLSGNGDGKFSPDAVMNTDEGTVMAARVLWQANGGTGALPTGPDPAALVASLGDYNRNTPFHGVLDSAQLAAALWSWDGTAYLIQQGAAADTPLPILFSAGYATQPVSRWQFFNALAFATRSMGLPVLNDVNSLPDSEDAGVLGLYRAGILAGTDGCGSFKGTESLTRAEAAAALARIAEPSLRLTFTLESAPDKGYTLTYLADGTPGCGTPNTSLCNVNDDDFFYNLDGKKIPWPEGGTPSSALNWRLDYLELGTYNADTPDNPYDVKMGLLGKDGFVIPQGVYEWVGSTADGHLLGVNFPNSDDKAQTFLLDSTGTVLLEFPDLEGVDWYSFNEGVAPRRDPATGLCGYVDQTGAWAVQPQWNYASGFSGGYAVIGDDQDREAIMDRQGNLVLPYEDGSFDTYRVSPGYTGSGLFYHARYDGISGVEEWVSPTGARYPRIWNSMGFANGYAAVSDPQVGTTYYLGLDAQRVSETFQWCGDIGADGRGFVGRENKVYRIQFE